MNLLSLIYNSFRKRGVIPTFKIIYYDLIFDVKYGTDTMGLVNRYADDESQQSIKYQPANYYMLRKIFEHYKSEINDSVFVDFGSGKGRVLLMACEYGAREVIGVELDTELAKVGEDNVERYLNKKRIDTKLEIRNENALSVDLSADRPNIIFFYNPFDRAILDEVLKKNKFENTLYIYFEPIDADLFIERGYKNIEKFGNDAHVFKSH